MSDSPNVCQKFCAAFFDVQWYCWSWADSFQRVREVAWFDVPDHAAGIFVTACPLLNDRSVALRAVPGIHAQAGEIVLDEEAVGPSGDAAPTRKPPLVIDGHKAERHEYPELGGKTDVASALLDEQAGPVEVAVLRSRRETLATPDIDQWDREVLVDDLGARRPRRRDQDHGRYRYAC